MYRIDAVSCHKILTKLFTIIAPSANSVYISIPKYREAHQNPATIIFVAHACNNTIYIYTVTSISPELYVQDTVTVVLSGLLHPEI